MPDAVSSQQPRSAVVQHWLAEGESLYAAALDEYRALQAELAEVEDRVRGKGDEVDQIAHILRKPLVERPASPAAAARDSRPIQPGPSIDDALRMLAESRCGGYAR